MRLEMKIGKPGFLEIDLVCNDGGNIQVKFL